MDLLEYLLDRLVHLRKEVPVRVRLYLLQVTVFFIRFFVIQLSDVYRFDNYPIRHSLSGWKTTAVALD